VETIRRLAREEKIPAMKVGRGWRFKQDELIHWAETHHKKEKQPCILVIDDDQVVRELIALFLEREGYQVILVSDGLEGLMHLEDKAIDLILLDLKMPKMNGPEFLRRCREINPDLPVIVVTGYPDSILMMEAMQYGPLMMLAKPIIRKPLVQAVSTILKTPVHEAQGHMKASF